MWSDIVLIVAVENIFGTTKSSVIAETARVTRTSVTSLDRVTQTVTPNMTDVNFISLMELSVRGILYLVTLPVPYVD